jgi:peroxiredoxin
MGGKLQGGFSGMIYSFPCFQRKRIFPCIPACVSRFLDMYSKTNRYARLHRLRLGSIAPDFNADTTNGPINFHEFIGDSWVILFSHPEDYTPVCTTELGAFAKLEPEFTKRGVKLIGLSANTLESHSGWIKDINELSNTNLTFPIIADKERKVSFLYDM